jgi:hypothetical protein
MLPNFLMSAWLIRPWNQDTMAVLRQASPLKEVELTHTTLYPGERFMKAFGRIGMLVLFLASSRLGGFAQSNIITTYAGTGTAGFSGDGGAATAARLWNPIGVAIDAADNLYISDSNNHRIRKITAAGVISTVAGNGASSGALGDGGLATTVPLGSLYGVAVDAAGNLYFAELNNNRVRKVNTAGVISTVAGNGTQGFSGDGGPATAAQFYYPFGVVVDAAGNLYISDINNNRVRKVNTSGVISTVAGNGSQSLSGDGAPATAAGMVGPSGLAMDAAGNLYIAEMGGRIRKVTKEGVISTVAGNGTAGFGGDGGVASAAQLNQPRGVAVDSVGNLYLADWGNNRIRKVTKEGVISTVAGNGTAGFGGDGGVATAAQLNQPWGVAVGSGNSLYIVDFGNSRIRKLGNSDLLFFPQIAVGAGYSTHFTITNTGATAATGNLILTNANGEAFVVSGTLTDSSGVAHPASSGSVFALTIPSGGTVFLSAAGLSSSSPIQVGWGSLESSGGSLSAVASYEGMVGTTMQTTVGILHSQLVQYATMPVDNDNSKGKKMVYAMANPSRQTISIKLALVGQDGTVVDDTVAVSLGPGEQKARYFSQDLGLASFKGSLVFRVQGGTTFVVVGLLYKGDLLTAIPVIPGKAPGIPD